MESSIMSIIKDIGQSLLLNWLHKVQFRTRERIFGQKPQKAETIGIRRRFCTNNSAINSRSKMESTMQENQNSALTPSTPKSLSAIEEFLNRWLRPSVYGESWDNIGLLIGSGNYTKKDKMVSSILLCNDLTTAVTNEAMELGVQLIIAYHPPIFSPLKRIGFSWKDSIISKCLAHDISVYSPHTTLDSVAFGINDSIIRMMSVLSPSKDDFKIRPIVPNSSPLIPVKEMTYKVKPVVAVKIFEALNSLQDLSFGFDVADARRNGNDSFDPDAEIQLSIFLSGLSPDGRVNQITDTINCIFRENTRWSSNLDGLPTGAGKIIEFKTPKKLAEIQKRLQTKMRIKHLKVADAGKEIHSVAVCAGAGGSLFKDVDVDLVITGEMSHHEVLDSVEKGISVILCGHSNSERHYLPTLAHVLDIFINCPDIHVSKCDTNVLDWV